jgi:hypothetical protein
LARSLASPTPPGRLLISGDEAINSSHPTRPHLLPLPPSSLDGDTYDD